MLQKLAYWYLVLLPFAVAAGGFGLPEMKPVIYIPIWIILVLFMLVSYLLTRPAQQLRSTDRLPFAGATPALLAAPWFFISIFFGFGPPPETIEAWVAELGEQQVRYSILLLSGVLVTTGFILLTSEQKSRGEKFFSTVGLTAILLAAPLYLLNMAFWGSFLGEAFKSFAASGSANRPDWYPPIRALFEWIGTASVALIYVATAAYAFSLKRSGSFKRIACNWYIGFSIAGLFLDLAGPLLPGPFVFAGFFVSIPAIPLIMPYLIGVNLLRA